MQAFNQGFTRLKMLNDYIPFFSNYNGDLYKQNVVRACIHAIAAHTAKLKPVVKIEGIPPKRLANIKYLLENKPNEYMNRVDFIYKTVSMLLTSGNAFIYTRYDDNGNVIGLYPINYRDIEFWEYQGELIVKFSFKTSGFTVYIPYQELIHLRRHYNENDLFGSNPREVLNPVINLMNAANDSMINAVRATGQLRGIIEATGNYSPADLKQKKDEFVTDYMNISGDGVGILDSKMKFTPVEIKPVLISERQQRLIIDNVCMAYGVSEAILKGDYGEDQYNAFYNSCIEPSADLLSLSFTNNLFSKDEITQGCCVLMSADKMTFANNATKSAMCRDMVQLGIFSINECRRVFELDDIADGDRHIVSLNYVNLNKADDYQGVAGNADNNGGNDDKT
jgi:HK97 family phage portal protein